MLKVILRYLQNMQLYGGQEAMDHPSPPFESPMLTNAQIFCMIEKCQN